VKYSLAPCTRVKRTRVFNQLRGEFVDENREVALQFAADIAKGLLECIEQDLVRRTAEDKSGLAAVHAGKASNASRIVLTKRPIGWSRQGSVAFSGPVFQYEADGMPAGEKALISEFNRRWRVMRVKDGIGGDWTGDYADPDEAMNALSRELNDDPS
jgi:hypothetical protein